MKAYRIKFSTDRTINFIVKSIFELRFFDYFKKHRDEITEWQFIDMWTLNERDLIAC